MSKDNLDEASYLKANPDVASAVKNGLFESGLAHYRSHGITEKRSLSTDASLTRADRALFSLDKNGLGLEIGPSHNPIAPKCEGYKVQVLDYLDQKALQRKYADHGQYGVDLGKIEEVDFVWQGQPLSELIGRMDCYDWIIASHVVEHVPDMITFLQQCELLLSRVGLLSLVIPDKRYCFDHLKPCSSTGELLDAFHVKRTRPSVGQVFDHFANACKRGEKIAWDSSESEDLELIHSFAQARSLWEQATTSDSYLDTHCWRFTPESFRLMLEDLRMLGLLSLHIVNEFPTFGCEFYITLGKMPRNPEPRVPEENRLALLQAKKCSEV